MADSDPISDSTPHKRRKVDHDTFAHSKGWDSQDDDGDDLEEADFHTVPTQALPTKRKLGYSAQAFQSDIDSMTMPKSSQPNPKAPYVTQPTQPLPPQSSTVLVDRSSPPLMSPPAKPAPSAPAPFARPRGGLLASSLAPSGTAFRLPAGVQSKKPETINLVDSDDDSDSPIQRDSDDDETQGVRSNIKPTTFKKGGRGLNSTPNRPTSGHIVKESPYSSSAGRSQMSPPTNSNTVFGSLMSSFGHQEGRGRGDDMASAYGGVSRKPRPQQQPQTGPARAKPVEQYQTIDDVLDFNMRRKIQRIRNILPQHSVQACHDAIIKKHGNADDAMDLLAQAEDEVDELGTMTPVVKRGMANLDVDELGTMSPVAKRGVAGPVSQRSSTSKDYSQQSSQPVKPGAKQTIKAPTRSIFDKYGTQAPRVQPQPSQAATQDDDEDDVKPKRRLIQGRKPVRSPSPESPQKLPQASRGLQQQKRKTVITLDETEDEEEDSGGQDDSEGEDEVEIIEETSDSPLEVKLLKIFNEWSIREVSGLCAEPEDVVKFVLDQRPFTSLDDIRMISQETEEKPGKKKAKARRAIGDKIVDFSSEMLTGYDAVDELVEECEKIANPIQQALKGWGVGDGSVELQLMNLEEAQDSGIGTPASSCAGDVKQTKPKGKFLSQPESMGEKVVLKDYQLVGLNWLNLLWSKKISCILADDMGLGKTCQVISFLAHLQEQEVDGVHLVIVPGSTLENWLREFQHFAPQLNVIPYYGSQAERPELQVKIEDEFNTIDVIVTTYEMTRAPHDNKFLRNLGPSVCVYDEAHALRNPKSDRYTQLMKIKADFKVLLTGTPLQNNLQELVAILAFIMPDLFEGKKEDLDYIFKHKATTKDTESAALLSKDRIARARTMMTPFILRRKKQQVLDLPTKHSRVDWCDLTETQADYYNSLITTAQQLFAEKATNAKSRAKAAKESSNIMMALRKAAIHPLLARRIYTEKKLDKILDELMKNDEFGSNPPDRVRGYIDGTATPSLKGGDFGLHVFCSDPGRPYLHKFALKKQEWMDSGKVHEFKKLVTEYQKNGDRLLVFSQFTTVMDILEAVLETLQIKFFRLDGSTQMDTRQDMIDEFYDDTSIPVFMLSTKAGGAGINLACANKVIIFDSGFNPQDDIQAENRAHRVGQTREVEVVRLVTKGTIEQQIHALGESKLALDEQVAGEGATAAEDKQAEKSGQEMVEKMLRDSLNKKEAESETEPKKEPENTPKKEPKSESDGDLKDAFKMGMESAGVKIESKQAQF